MIAFTEARDEGGETVASGDAGITDVPRVPLPQWLAWAVAAVASASFAALVLALAASGRSLEEAVNGWQLHNAAGWALIGALIVRHRRGHPIGWLLVAVGGCDMLDTLLAIMEYAPAIELSGRVGSAVAQLDALVRVPTVALIAMGLPLLLPDGRLESREARALAAWGVGVSLALMVALAFGGGSGGSPAVTVVLPLFGLTQVACLVLLIARFRRATGDERQQLKYVFYGLALSIPPLVAGTAGVSAFGLSPAWALPALVIVPVAVAIAVMRYRLHDIDVVIWRTLVYALLVATVTGLYVAIVVGAGTLLDVADVAHPVLAITATAAVAVVFQPLRRRSERLANRLVFGRRATPYDVLSAYARRIGAVAGGPLALDDLADLIAKGTGAAPARVWLRVGERLRPAAAAPGDVDGDPAAQPLDAVSALPHSDHVEPVIHDGRLLGALTITKPRGERVSDVDVDLLGRLAASSGVLLSNLRMDAELSERLEELQASRRRLLAAEDDAHRRIERALDRGARQHLAHLQAQLTSIQQQVDGGVAPRTAALLQQLVTATDGAARTLDALASGLYPPSLARGGLPAALEEQAAKAPLPVGVDASEVGRHPQHVEVAVYFAVLEALQNTAKHARAASARVVVRQRDGLIEFVVTDDGVGFDTSAPRGTGLAGMAERLDTWGGVAEVTSRPGAGTTVRGLVPLDAAAGRPGLTGAPR